MAQRSADLQSQRGVSPHSPGLYRAAMFDAGAWLARRLPLGSLRSLAGIAGWFYAITHPQRVAIVRQNLQLLDPSLNEKSAQQVYAEFGKTLADYFHVGTRSPEQAMQIVAKSEGLEHLHAAHQLGKGVLIVTAHFGLFELGGLLMAQAGFPCAVVTYPEPTRDLTDWRAAFRHGWGVDTIEVGADSFAFLQIASSLRAGKCVASLVDRPHPTDSTPVALPNGTAHFSTGILLLAAHGGIPVVPAMMARQSNGTYHSRIFPPLFIEPRESRAETVRFYSQQIADTLIPVLCAHPEQWYQFVPLAPPS